MTVLKAAAGRHQNYSWLVLTFRSPLVSTLLCLPHLTQSSNKMAPCVVDMNTKVGKEAANALNLASIRKAIPEEAFQKSAFISSQYMIRDYACWGASVYAMYSLANSSLWNTMPLWQKAAATLLFWNVAGFFMWCMFMIGHECGHTTFSDSAIINDVVGLFTHGSLLVPFHPWQVRIGA